MLRIGVDAFIVLLHDVLTSDRRRLIGAIQVYQTWGASAFSLATFMTAVQRAFRLVFQCINL